jgi:hypothetical protein
LWHQVLPALAHHGVVNLGLGQESDPDSFHLQPGHVDIAGVPGLFMDKVKQFLQGQDR